jgi:glutamyl-Q tRNA(Asp) synthetase
VRTRFAPSPTGPLHLGHAFSALTAHALAEAEGGEFILRIEDIDTTRCRPEFEAGIYEDLGWLGLRWPEPVLRQTTRAPAYAAALARLRALGLVYPCTCTRAEIAALSAPQEGVAAPVYPGTCRGRTDAPDGAAWRLDLARALAAAGSLTFEETGPARAGRHPVDPAALVAGIGDIILSRKDIGTSYHLAVVLDDAAQGITHVVRGEDLAAVTPLHRLLQALLDLPVPVWHHHRLIRDASGRRLAKRDAACALATLRAEGTSPGDVRRMVGLG